MSVETDAVPGWEDTRRAEGVAVMVTEHGTWAILVPGRPLRLICPCCDKPFGNARAAKLVADALYPPAGSEWGATTPTPQRP